MENNYLLCECECSFIEELGWEADANSAQEAYDFFKENFPEELDEIWLEPNNEELEEGEEPEERFNPEAWSCYMYDKDGIKYAVIGDGGGSGTCYYVQVSSNNVKDKIENLLELEKINIEFSDVMTNIAKSIENDIEDIDESDLTVLSDSEVELPQNPEGAPLFKGKKPDAMDSEETSRGNIIFEALLGTRLNMIDVETVDKAALAAGYRYKYSDNGINYYWE